MGLACQTVHNNSYQQHCKRCQLSILATCPLPDTFCSTNTEHSFPTTPQLPQHLTSSHTQHFIPPPPSSPLLCLCLSVSHCLSYFFHSSVYPSIYCIYLYLTIDRFIHLSICFFLYLNINIQGTVFPSSIPDLLPGYCWTFFFCISLSLSLFDTLYLLPHLAFQSSSVSFLHLYFSFPSSLLKALLCFYNASVLLFILVSPLPLLSGPLLPSLPLFLTSPLLLPSPLITPVSWTLHPCTPLHHYTFH